MLYLFNCQSFDWVDNQETFNEILGLRGDTVPSRAVHTVLTPHNHTYHIQLPVVPERRGSYERDMYIIDRPPCMSCLCYAFTKKEEINSLFSRFFDQLDRTSCFKTLVCLFTITRVFSSKRI